MKKTSGVPSIGWKYIDFADLLSIHLEITRQSYDTHSREYADRWEWSKQLVEKTKKDYLLPFMESVKKNGVVLVVGCGTGRDIKTLSEAGYACLGTDISMGMLDEAIKNNEIKLPFICESIEKVELAKESFDGILIDSALEHVRKADMTLVLQKLYEALNVGGTCLIRFRIGTGMVFIVEDEVGIRYFNSYTESDLDKLIQSTNFKLIKKFISNHADEARPGFITFILRK